MSGSGREALPDVRERLGGSPGCPGVFGRLSRMASSCQEALSYPVIVGRPSRMSGSGREALPDVWEWSGGPLGCPTVVERPSRSSGSGLEALPVV